MTSSMSAGLKPSGLGIAKLTIRANDPATLDVVYYCDEQALEDDHSVRHATLRSGGAPITVPGRHSLVADGEGAGSSPYVFEIDANEGAGRQLKLTRDGEILAQGRGCIDPDEAEAILVSWWSGEVRPYGTVKYRIRDEETIIGKYISETTALVPGVDTVKGDTTNGFPGSYVLHTLGPDGRKWGPHIWDLTRRGDIIDLCWTEEGRVICRGFGFIEPEDTSSIVVTYVAV